MTDYKHEYQKYADESIRNREKEDGFGRLRFSLFCAVAGPLACFLVHLLKFELQSWMPLVIVGTAPVAILLGIVNFIRLPNDSKASPAALLISLMTLLGAGATLALAKMWEIWR